MSYDRHIHITGHARTGTTLMKNLMHCFEETFVTMAERKVDEKDVARWANNKLDKKIVTKFPGFGVGIHDEFPGINVICMYRDPRDMYCSQRLAHRAGSRKVRWWHDNERRNPGGFASNISGLTAMLKHPLTLAVRYEELVTDPDAVQEVIAQRFDLTIKHPFSKGDELFRSESTDKINFAMNGIRPPDTDSIGNWRKEIHIGVVKAWLRDNPEISQFIKEMGYEEA
jgi:hypothetical protein